MRILMVAAVLLLVGSASDRAAAVEYPWCAIYGDGNGGINCGFTSLAQCRAALAGNGGECQRNWAYVDRRRRR